MQHKRGERSPAFWSANPAMQARVKKWGNYAPVRIPAVRMASAGLKLDAPVEISEEDGRIVAFELAGLRQERQRFLRNMDGIGVEQTCKLTRL